MSYNNKELKKSSSSLFEKKILKYINSSEVIKELPLKKLSTYESININKNSNNYNKKDKKEFNANYIFDKSPILKNKNKPKFLKSFSENELFLPYYNSKNLNTKNYKINNNRPFSGLIYPCKTIGISKKNGSSSQITLNLYTNNNNFSPTKKSFSSRKRTKKLKIKEDDIFQNIKKYKSPLELLLEKKENEFNLKLSSKKMISNQKLLSNFMKKNFKYIRSNSFNDNYYYIKSKLNKTTKSAEKKLCNQEVPLKFDNEKYKKFRTISKKIKNHLLSNNKKMSIKELLEQIKKLKNEKNKERISLLKEDIEDNKILYTPQNFIKFRKDDFSYYKLNQLIKKLNCDFTYEYRFIIANKFDIQLDDYISK